MFGVILVIYARSRSIMSVSSVGSMVSVGFHGREVGMEEALDETVRALQRHLNLAQCHLREIAAVVERNEEYEQELKLSWDLDEDLLQMSFLFEDLRMMSLDLISTPQTPEEKALAKKWKIDRKEHERKLISAHAT